MDGRITLAADGRLLVARPAVPGEADRLRALHGLAVPEVVDEGDELVLTWHPPAESIAAVAAEVAEVLAAAHERGVCHGPLRAEHVRAGGIVDGWTGGDTGDDVAAFGRLLLETPGVGPALTAVATRAAAEDAAVRPTMRAVAEALRPPPPFPASAKRRELQVPRWAPAAAAIPVALAALAASGGDASPAAVAVELRCERAAAAAVLAPGSGELRLDDGTTVAEVPPGCEVVIVSRP